MCFGPPLRLVNSSSSVLKSVMCCLLSPGLPDFFPGDNSRQSPEGRKRSAASAKRLIRDYTKKTGRQALKRVKQIKKIGKISLSFGRVADELVDLNLATPTGYPWYEMDY